MLSTLSATLLAFAIAAPGNPGTPDTPKPPTASGDSATDGGDEPTPRAAAPKRGPWWQGVSAAQRSAATKLLTTGNQFFGKQAYAQALTEYEKAVKFWNHPSINFNMAVCLLNLTRQVEALRWIKQALRYGQGPLTDQTYRVAQTHLKVLNDSLARIEVVAKEAATISLDGKPLFEGPGSKELFVKAGPHQLVATRDKYVTMTKTVNLASGKKTVVNIKLVLVTSSITYKRRFARWIPWAVLGAGAAVAAAGMSLYFSARNDFRDHDSEFSTTCGGGCFETGGTPLIPSNLTSLKKKAQAEFVASMVLIPIGATAIAAGITLAILNIPRAVEERSGKVPIARKRLRITPTITPGGAGISAALRF